MNKNHQKLGCNVDAMELLEDLCRKNILDKDIQAALLDKFNYKWTLNSISRQRRKIGYNKRDKTKLRLADINQTNMTVPPKDMDKDMKPTWFRQQFKKTNMYRTLKKQFDKDEIEIYIDNYGNLCCQFEDIVLSEFFQIDDFLKHRILVNRELISVKDIKYTMEEINKWIDKNPTSDTDTGEIKKMRLQYVRKKEEYYRQLKQCNDRYDRLLSEMNAIYKNLNATRRDRLEEIKGGRESFLEIVSDIQASAKERESQGKYAALTKIAADDILDEFRKEQVFPDGSKDCIILDYKSEIRDD